MKLAKPVRMTTHNAAVWLDHREAKIFRLEGTDFENPSVLHAPHSHVKRHETTTAEHGHPADAQHYYHAVITALRDATSILVVGPSSAKLEFIKHIHRHDAALVSKVVGVETVDHPTDKQLAAYARAYFAAKEASPA